MNKFSKIITQDKSQGASQAMLYALKLTKKDMNKAQIGIGSNWFESNPCNSHLNDISKRVKDSLTKEQLIGFQFNTIGVSDGITMGTKGMLYSLPSREIIADSYETINLAHSYDGNIAIPGCDKNLPGCIMGMIRINCPSFMIYGGTIRPGRCNNKDINIVDAFQSYGRYINKEIDDNEREHIIQNACPGPGSCGGMYTANTMASAIEAMGMMLPNSSSNPAKTTEKYNECVLSGKIITNLLINDIKPKDIITKQSIENAITMGIALGGSTNLVLHMLAIAKTANIDIDIDIFNRLGKNIPVIGNFKPHGKYLMNDLYNLGGTSLVTKLLYEMGLLHGECLTITGKTIKENVDHINLDNVDFKDIILKNDPIKKDSHIRILYGNLAPKSAVAKITGKEGSVFKGIARVFESENGFLVELEKGNIKKGNVIIIRNQGPIGGPGMPEMLKPTSAIIGYGLENDIAFITDGRFSGGSHGFIIGHVTPEASEGGPIAYVQDGDTIIIDSIKNSIDWIANPKNTYKYYENNNDYNYLENNHYLQKYKKLVQPANQGCTTL
jgi:dihydroxy-acid dehydratase